MLINAGEGDQLKLRSEYKIKIYHQNLQQQEIMFRSSGSDRYESKANSKGGCCCIKEYEDQINILQQKLMQIHNKLIQQLDVCQQQELTIIDLTKKIMNLESQSIAGIEESGSFVSSNIDADVSKDSQQFNKACFYQNKNCEFTLNNSNQLLMSNYNSPTFLQNNRNQLLKADLEAMRTKLLQQVTQKTSLKQELNQLRSLHSQKMAQYRKQVKDLQNDHEFLLKEYEYIKMNLEKGNLKKNDKNLSSSQVIELNEKCNEYERLYKKEVNLNQEVNQKIVELKSVISGQKQKIKFIEEELQKYTHCIKSTSTAADGLRDQRDREQLCGTIRISNKNPGTLWERDSNKSKASQQKNLTDTEVFKRRNTVTEVKHAKEKQADSLKQNKENIHESVSSIKSLNKEKISKNNKKEDYESTKELIRKLQEAQMQTRQRRKIAFA